MRTSSSTDSSDYDSVSLEIEAPPAPPQHCFTNRQRKILLIVLLTLLTAIVVSGLAVAIALEAISRPSSTWQWFPGAKPLSINGSFN